MKATRRRLLIGAGLAAGALAVPTVQHLRWSRQTFTRPGYPATPPPPRDGETFWMNWSGIQRATPRQIAVPATEDALVDLITSSNGSVRPVGSGHSFSGLVPTDGTLVDVSRLSGLIASDERTGTVTFGAGTRLRQAAMALQERGLALPNLPDIDVQTLAGSFATATHGTGAGLTALHDYIRRFRLVTAGGAVLDVDRERNPELFQAGRVSLGALGIITRFELAVVPAFALRRRVWVESLHGLLDRAHELAADHRNFEFFYFPGTGYAAAITHDLHDGAVTGRAAGEDDTLLEDLESLRNAFGWWPWLRQRIASLSIPEGTVEDSSDESWRLLATPRPIRFNEMEYELPVDQGPDVLLRIIRRLEARKTPYFPLEIRYVAADDAWLSPFNSGPRMAVSVHADVAEPYDYFFSELEPLFRQAGGRPHWGKLHSLGAAELQAEYPDFTAFNALRRSLDPDGRFLNSHLAALFGEPVGA